MSTYNRTTTCENCCEYVEDCACGEHDEHEDAMTEADNWLDEQGE